MFKIIEPTGILKKYIKNYCIVEINNSMDYLPCERVFPHGNITLVFHYGLPSKFKGKKSNEYIESNLVICGQQTGYYDLSLSGKTGMILIFFKPHGVKPFFNLPINDLQNKNLSMSDLIKNEAIELEDKLFNSKNNEQRIIQLERFLTKRLSTDHDFKRIEHAIKLIENSKGRLKSKVVAQELCLGIKQFERIFSKHVGLNPKKYANIIRFQNVLQMKMNNENANIFELTFDNGYYDQSHFIHDIKNITGLSPRKFFNNRK